MTNHIMTKLTNLNHDQKHKHYHLATTLHLTLKMTTGQELETTTTVFLKTTLTRMITLNKYMSIHEYPVPPTPPQQHLYCTHKFGI